ncbi:MAG: hypothetical protein IJS09_07395 [Treponema sp.]|nr:hypothetical protein [Treponema sp.]
MKRIILVCGLLLSMAALFAKNISVQIIQNNPATNGNVCASSSLIEQTIIGYFFDSGYIVSSSPVYIGTDKDSGSLKTALKENAEGGMDYLVRVEVDYTADSTNPEAILLANIKQVTWKNYAVSTGKELSAGSEKIGTVNRQDNNENGVTSFANLVAAKINAGLRAR